MMIEIEILDIEVTPIVTIKVIAELVITITQSMKVNEKVLGLRTREYK